MPRACAGDAPGSAETPTAATSAERNLPAPSDNFQDAPTPNSLYVFLHRRVKDQQYTVSALSERGAVPDGRLSLMAARRLLRHRERTGAGARGRARGGSPTGAHCRHQWSERLHRKLVYPSEPETGTSAQRYLYV